MEEECKSAWKNNNPIMHVVSINHKSYTWRQLAARNRISFILYKTKIYDDAAVMKVIFLPKLK